MDTNPTIKNFIIVILPAILTVFIIFFLVMPRVRENRVDNTGENMMTSLTPEECIELGGQPLNTVGGATCSEGEENVGEVIGFISPNICCVPSVD